MVRVRIFFGSKKFRFQVKVLKFSDSFTPDELEMVREFIMEQRKKKQAAEARRRRSTSSLSTKAKKQPKKSLNDVIKVKNFYHKFNNINSS